MQKSYLEISEFWENNPCFGGNPDFPFRFWKNKKVLEIGCGGGIDAFRFATSGAIYTGVDLTERAVKITRIKLKGLGKVFQMNSELLDFPNDYFDLVYSFGVIHHTANPKRVLKEALRVLKPDGILFIMLYNKMSFRYLIEINILRRILWFFNHPKFSEIRNKIPHPTKEEWLSINTDNIGCPLSRAYTKKDIELLLKDFEITSTWTENYGWFRMICARKNSII